jgi:hypothetical protein
MATYMGRDTSKLKNKGGKWKYVISPPHTRTSQWLLVAQKSYLLRVFASNNNSASAHLRPLKNQTTHMILIQHTLQMCKPR